MVWEVWWRNEGGVRDDEGKEALTSSFTKGIACEMGVEGVGEEQGVWVVRDKWGTGGKGVGGFRQGGVRIV